MSEKNPVPTIKMPRELTSDRKHILITGVAGFIGSNLAERLLNIRDSKFEVTGIDNLACGLKEQIPDGVDFYEMDIRSKGIYSLFNEVDVVFHLAAKNCINDCQIDPVETAEINVAGTVNVFEAAKRAGVKKVIYAETSAMYEGSSTFPTSESEVKPQSFYAVSKLASMYFAEAFRRYYSLNLVALRYFNVYGPRQDYRRTIPPVMSAFIIKLLRRESPIIYGDGSKRRDFIHINDVNNFHLLCLNNQRTDGRVFNIGSGRNYSISDIYNEICEILKTHVSPIFKLDLPGEAQETLADISEAKALGWKPMVDIRSGLRDMVTYIKNEMDMGRIL